MEQAQNAQRQVVIVSPPGRWQSRSSEVLRRAGYDVVVADDCTALGTLELSPTCVVVLDWPPEEVAGVEEAVMRVRAADPIGNARIIQRIPERLAARAELLEVWRVGVDYCFFVSSTDTELLAYVGRAFDPPGEDPRYERIQL